MKLPPELKRRFKTPMTNTQRQEVIIRDCAMAAADIAADREATKETQKFIQDAILARYDLMESSRKKIRSSSGRWAIVQR